MLHVAALPEPSDRFLLHASFARLLNSSRLNDQILRRNQEKLYFDTEDMAMPYLASTPEACTTLTKPIEGDKTVRILAALATCASDAMSLQGNETRTQSAWQIHHLGQSVPPPSGLYEKPQGTQLAATSLPLLLGLKL